jgi:ABC transport system ATP-binding/permease protein
VQNVIYLIIANSILEVREMFFPTLVWMTLTSLSGLGIGLLISSIVRDAKTALNIIPLILIPQIILGGALIKYEEMNQNLDFAYGLKRWISPSDSEESDKPNQLRVPLICDLMPLRWSYESIILSMANHNPYTAAQNEITERIKALSKRILEREKLKLDAKADEALLSQAKDALATVSSLREHSPAAIARRIQRILEDVAAGSYDDENHRPKEAAFSAERLFQNEKILALVTKADMVRLDRHRQIRPNVFFGIEKHYRLRIPFFGREIDLINLKADTLDVNFTMLLLWIFLPLLILFLILRRQLRRV